MRKKCLQRSYCTVKIAINKKIKLRVIYNSFEQSKLAERINIDKEVTKYLPNLKLQFSNTNRVRINKKGLRIITRSGMCILIAKLCPP